MKKRFQQNQCKLIKEHFSEHPYYKLSQSVFDVFQELCPTMLMTPEQLFSDAVCTIDVLLRTGDKSFDVCNSLWTTTYKDYREQDGTAGDKNDTMAEVTMLFYLVMYGVMAVNHSHFRATLQTTLHDLIYKFYSRKNCLVIESKLREPVNQHTEDMLAWMEQYFDSADCLSQEIDQLVNPQKSKKGPKTDGKKKKTLFTLAYNCGDTNLRSKRLGFVRRKWEEWGWIESNTDVTNFEYFFEGKPRDCQLKWIENNALLAVLLKNLLQCSNLFTKQIGCTPRSVVINQFHKTYDKHQDRLDDLDNLKIYWSIIFLDYTKPLELPQLQYHNGEDISDRVLQEVFSGNMHITKTLK